MASVTPGKTYPVESRGSVILHPVIVPYTRGIRTRKYAVVKMELLLDQFGIVLERFGVCSSCIGKHTVSQPAICDLADADVR